MIPSASSSPLRSPPVKKTARPYGSPSTPSSRKKTTYAFARLPKKADKEALEAAQKSLEQNIKNQAKTIAELYINVPKTTDFAIMFLATEGLYSEVLRRPGLCEEIQNKYRIMICGPTTITAFLNTLNVGFRTIALNKKTTEIQKTLSAVSSQYDLFESLLAKAKKKIDEAGSSIEAAQKRNTTIQRKLHNVDKMDADEAEALLNSGE